MRIFFVLSIIIATLGVNLFDFASSPPALKISYEPSWYVEVGNKPITRIKPTIDPFYNGKLTFSVVDGELEEGLELEPRTGIIHGTPTKVQIPHRRFTIKATYGSMSAEAFVHIAVVVSPQVAYGKPSYIWIKGNHVDKHTPTIAPLVEADRVIYSWSGNPDGMTLNTSTGEIEGTPTKDGKFKTIVTATMRDGLVSGSVTIPIEVREPPIVSAAQLNIKQGATDLLTITGGVPPYNVVVTVGGKSVSPGVVNQDGGTTTYQAPMSNGQMTVTATDSSDQKVSGTVNVNVGVAYIKCSIDKSKDATPQIEACISQLDPTVGGTVAIPAGLYTLKTPLDLAPKRSIVNLTLQTDGVPANRDCNAPPDTNETIGSPSGPKVDCAILQADSNFPNGAKLLGAGAVVVSGHLLYNSTFNQIIVDGNHQNRGNVNSALYKACADQASTRGFNVSINGNNLTYNYFQSVNGLCGNCLDGGLEQSTVTYNHIYVGHCGGLYPKQGNSGDYFWSDGLGFNGPNKLVQYSTFQDNVDYNLIVGPVSYGSAPEQKPEGDSPSQILHNHFIVDENSAMRLLGFNNWTTDETAQFNYADGSATTVEDNYFNCNGLCEKDGGSTMILGNEQGHGPAVVGGLIQDNHFVSGVITCDQASGYVAQHNYCDGKEDVSCLDTSTCQ